MYCTTLTRSISFYFPVNMQCTKMLTTMQQDEFFALFTFRFFSKRRCFKLACRGSLVYWWGKSRLRSFVLVSTTPLASAGSGRWSLPPPQNSLLRVWEKERDVKRDTEPLRASGTTALLLLARPRVHTLSASDPRPCSTNGFDRYCAEL